MKTIKAGVLEVAHLEFGPRNGWPVVLSHGFPFDVHAYNEVAPALADLNDSLRKEREKPMASPRFLPLEFCWDQNITAAGGSFQDRCMGGQWIKKKANSARTRGSTFTLQADNRANNCPSPLDVQNNC
jgi:hypothetical protein